MPAAYHLSEGTMRVLAFAVAIAATTVLFGAFGSLGVTAAPSVRTTIVSMHAVLPDGARIDLQTHRRALFGWTL
jgi:hypothetical protein